MSLILNTLDKTINSSNRILTKAEAKYVALKSRKVTVIYSEYDKVFFFTNNANFGSIVLPDTFISMEYKLNTSIKHSLYETLDDVVESKFKDFKLIKNLDGLAKHLESLQNA